MTDLNLAGDYWLADGYHRWHAATIAGLQTIGADVRPGGRREAILHSVGANAEHGWRRSNEDKRKAVLTLLNDREWSGWSDREIARRCGVDNKVVARLRPEPVSEGRSHSSSALLGRHVHACYLQYRNDDRCVAATHIRPAIGLTSWP